MTTKTQPAQPVKIGAAIAGEIQPTSLAQMALRRFLKHRMALFGVLLLLAIILYIVIGSFIFTEADANRNDPRIRLQPPSAEHPFGTDDIGRDVLARTIYGGQISLLIGISAMFVSVSLGTFIGAVSGYYGGLLDSLLMRLAEAIISIPLLLLLLLMARFFSGKIPEFQLFGREFSGSVVIIVIIIGVTSWISLSRIVRSSFLSLKESEFVLAARALGVPDRRIIIRHILPNTLAPIIVSATLGVAGAILSESYISFLGMGVQEPTASWGNMINGAYRYITTAPWLWLYPGILVVLTVMSINFVGDGLRDALDPRGDKKL
jgi:peptide/nickel transport system permease protein